MAYKRSRTTYEKDLQQQESPFVKYGTPLPPLDDETRDDGSYVPVWKQEVRDEQGRKRLHGAFTGGFSAGYFNTVGSKEGWTPSTFVSSRSNRHKDQKKQNEQRAEDFMDEEDLAEAAEAQILQTNQAFSGLGTTGEDEKRKGFMTDLLRNEQSTIGAKLLQKMGWRQGQGIGPRVRRGARLEDPSRSDGTEETEHLFAPENPRMISFVRKDDRKGLGYAGEGRLESVIPRREQEAEADEEEGAGESFGPPVTKKSNVLKPRVKQTGIGIGILNDTGSDDEDPYEVGPRISYNRVIGGSKIKANKSKIVKPPAQTAANPLLKSKPLFLSKKLNTPSGFRKCHDGRLPLPGFILADPAEQLISTPEDERWPRPKAPEGWVSTKTPTTATTSGDHVAYQSTANVARASKLDPKARAALLGEAQLPGKSIFDFLSTFARDRLASATGKSNLPAALNERPPEPSSTKSSSTSTTASASKPHSQRTQTQPSAHDIPALDKILAISALGRGISGWIPYAEDPPKLSRYRTFLEYRAELIPALPADHKPADTTTDAYLQELREFAHAAMVFKPMTGMMASRFTSSKGGALPQANTVNENATTTELLQKPAAAAIPVKPEDPAEEAARLGMFGPLTRSVKSFAPTRLVCKRFGVKPPMHVQSDEGAGDGVPTTGGHATSSAVSSSRASAAAWAQPASLVNEEAMREMVQAAGDGAAAAYAGRFQSGGVVISGEEDKQVGNKTADVVDGKDERRAGSEEIDVERNEALEGKRAGDAVFKAIFGSDDEDE